MGFTIAEEVRKILRQQPLLETSLLYERITAKYPEEDIKKPAVWTAAKRWREKNGDLLETARKNIYLVKDKESEEDGVSPVFKEMVKYAQWAERQGYPVTSQMVLSFFKETHKLSANEADIIRQEKLVEEVCQKIYDFTESVDWDPSIKDDDYLEDTEKQ